MVHTEAIAFGLVSATKTVLAFSDKPVIQKVDVVTATVLCLNVETFFDCLSIVALTVNITEMAVHSSFKAFCRMRAYQPSWEVNTTCPFFWTLGWHSCSCIPHKTIPASNKIIVTWFLSVLTRWFNVCSFSIPIGEICVFVTYIN